MTDERKGVAKGGILDEVSRSAEMGSSPLTEAMLRGDRGDEKEAFVPFDATKLGAHLDIKFKLPDSLLEDVATEKLAPLAAELNRKVEAEGYLVDVIVRESESLRLLELDVERLTRRVVDRDKEIITLKASRDEEAAAKRFWSSQYEAFSETVKEVRAERDKAIERCGELAKEKTILEERLKAARNETRKAKRATAVAQKAQIAAERKLARR